MHLPLYRKMQIGLFAIFATLLVVGAISFWAIQRAADSQSWVRHTNEVLVELANLGWALEVMQVASRRYAASGADEFLQEALNTRNRADQKRRVLLTLTADNTAQQHRLVALAELGRAAPPMPSSGDQAAKAVAGEAYARMFAPELLDAYRAVPPAMEQSEFLLLANREAQVERHFRDAQVTLAFGSTLGLTFIVLAGVVARRDDAAIGHTRAESDAQMRVLVEGVQDYAIFMLDPNGDVVSWNRGAERMKGYTAAEIIGQNFSCFYSPEDIDLGKPAAELREASVCGRTEVERWRVRKDGTRFLAELVITAARDTAGRLIGFSEISRDVSARNDREAKYRGLLEAAPDAIVVVNPAGRIVLLNVQAEKQFGYLRDELLALNVTKIVPEGLVERLLVDGSGNPANALMRPVESGIELQGRRKDGSVFPVEIMLSPHHSEDGVLVTAAIRDISVRKAAEVHLAATVGELAVKHSLLDAVVEGTSDPIYIRDLEHRFLLANKACAQLFGRSVSEMIGRTTREMLPNDTYYAVAQSDREIVRTGTTRVMEELAEIDGTMRTFLTTKGPYRDANHAIIGTIGIARDITERRSADESRLAALKLEIVVRENAAKHLAQMESRYRALLEAAPEAMVISDAQGRILLVNAQTEKLFGYRREELIGHAVEMLVPPQFRAKHPVHRGGYYGNPHTRSMGEGLELRGLRKDSSEFPVEIMLSPLETADGMLVTAVVRDIAERKKFQEDLLQTVGELKRSNDELEHFAYVASHDLQEPLRMVASYTQLLAKRYKGRLDSDADDFIAFAVDGSNRMQRLINDLLAYSRAGVSRKKPHKISSQSALHEALVNLQGTIAESGATVTHEHLPDVTMDETQLTQVFQNLIGNAIKYRGPEFPRVHISATSSAGIESVFSVSDNGLGIESQFFDKIFILFQRLHGRGEFEGTGIGLAICKKMLERAGGRIWVESEPGVGSTFHFAVPIGPTP
jgi:PAS domain S-box-containing protein